jgi:hypothetical protein
LITNLNEINTVFISVNTIDDDDDDDDDNDVAPSNMF